MLAVSFTLLALAWCFSYRKPLASCSQNTSCPEPACRLTRATLWLATILILVIAGVPTWSRVVIPRLAAKTEAFSGAPSTGPSTLRVRIPSMDCAACAMLIQKKIRAQTGIVNASVTFQQKEAFVKYEPSRITPAKIITVINETGLKVE